MPDAPKPTNRWTKGMPSPNPAGRPRWRDELANSLRGAAPDAIDALVRFANGLPAGHGAPPSPREQLKALELILFYAVGKPIQPLALDAELDTTQANRLLDSLQNKTTERLTSRLTELLALARQRRGEPDEAIDVAEVPALPGGTEGEP